PGSDRALVPAGQGAGATIEQAPALGRRRRKLLIAAAFIGLLMGLGGWYGLHYWQIGRFLVSTDDAYVHADATTLGAKVAGYVASVNVADNSPVHAGDIIATIDDGDYRLAVEQAAAKVATQEATVARLGQQIPAQQALVDE